MVKAIRISADVAVPPERAFELFGARLGTWWPREYTWSQDVLQEIGIEPAAGGMCFERGPHGFRCDWGRVLQWEPPARIAFTWQIGPGREPVPDPDRSSIVEVQFAAFGRGTRVALEHREFGRHGEGAGGYREALASPHGWPHILERFRAAAS